MGRGGAGLGVLRACGVGHAMRIIVLLVLLNLAASSVEIGHSDEHPEAHDTAPHQKKERDVAVAEHVKQIEMWEKKLAELETKHDALGNLLVTKDGKIAALQADIRKEVGAKNLGTSLESALSRVKTLEAEIVEHQAYSRELEQTVEALQSRADAAEASAESLLARIEKAESVIQEQKKKLVNADRALRIAEIAMRKAEAEVAAKAEELSKIYDGWLPPWAVTKIAELQVATASKWHEHGQPRYNLLKQEIFERWAQLLKLGKPYLTNLQKRWKPIITQVSDTVARFVSPYLEDISKQASKGYEASKEYVAPHFEKAQQFFDPYVQVVMEKTRPYTNTIWDAVVPHYQKVRTFAEPHIERVLTSATGYHQQLQASVKGTLSKHRVLSLLATKEVVWFLASLVVALPVFAGFVVFSSVFSAALGGKKHSKSHRPHKKPRRVKQADK